MHTFFAEFRIVGEIVDFMYLQEPHPKLLVDVALESPKSGPGYLRPQPKRIATEISNDLLAGQFLRQIKIGDPVELMGTFSQSDYKPHDVVYVDTTFCITEFRALEVSDERVGEPATYRPINHTRLVH